jgi:hypothetical protein
MQWQPQPTIDELVVRLKAAKEMRVPADAMPARNLSYLSDPDLIRCLTAKGQADFAQFMEETDFDGDEAVEIAPSTRRKPKSARVAPGKVERVNIERAGQILGLQPRTVQKMAQRAELPGAAKLGRRWTFNEDKLHTFVRHKERETWRAQKHQPDVTGAKMSYGAAPRSKVAKSGGRYTQIIQQLRASAEKPEKRAQLRIVTTETLPDFLRK